MEMIIMEMIIIYLAIIIGTFLYTIKDFGDYSVTPKQIYETNTMNMFRCVLISILFFVTNPLYDIAVFIYWIFHVGKKD